MHCDRSNGLQPELASACWRVASKIAEKPTRHIVARIVKTVEGAIYEGNGDAQPKAKAPPASEKKLFLLSVHRLAGSPWFSPQLIIQGLDEAKARKHLMAAQALLSRLHEVIGEIRQQFPEL